MELRLSGNGLKTFARSITCLSRIGNELAIQATPSQLTLHTLNSSRSAYQSITLKPAFFDVYSITGDQVQCSVLLKAICSVLRTPITSIDHLSVLLPNSDASKVQWILECYNGMKKVYWITCNVEPDIQHLSLDRRRLPSNFVVRPRDLSRLLANFQSTLQEITIIATEPSSLPSDVTNEIGGKAVELRSYLDPTKENDSSLHTQLWIDPSEEFVEYAHTGDPVDVTFGVKELKAFHSFCEGCEVDIHIYFEKAGEPIMMAPHFGLVDGCTSNFDATLVLATMLVSQLQDRNSAEAPRAAPTVQVQADNGVEAQAQRRQKGAVSEHPSDHTRIWSELSGSAPRSDSGALGRQVQGELSLNTNQQSEILRMSNDNGAVGRQVQGEQSLNTNEQGEILRMSTMQIPRAGPDRRNLPCATKTFQPVETDHAEEPRERAELNGHGVSQRHLSNWVDADEDEDEGEEDDTEPYVESTPPHHGY